jgi:hypothetical protein
LNSLERSSVKPAPQITIERPLTSLNGYLAAVAGVALIALPVISFVLWPSMANAIWTVLVRVVFIALGVFSLVGLYMLQPREAAILTLFGEYRGTDRSEGLRWANPLYTKRKISLRARNLNTPTQGERQARQPGGDWRGGGVARAGHRQGGVRRGRFRALRQSAG